MPLSGTLSRRLRNAVHALDLIEGNVTVGKLIRLVSLAAFMEGQARPLVAVLNFDYFAKVKAQTARSALGSAVGVIDVIARPGADP